MARTIPRKTLTTVRAIIHLSPIEAQSGYPVRLRGQVTYVDLEWKMMFLRCAEEPVFVVLPPQTKDIRAGDVVVLHGVTGTAPAGNFVQHVRFRMLFHKPLPTPPAVGLAALSNGADESLYVSTKGVLRPNQFLWNHTHLLLVYGHTSIPIVIPGGVETAPLRYVGNRVMVRGVAGAETNSKGQRVGTVLYLQNVKAIQPASSHWQDFLQAPVVSIASIHNLDVHQKFLPAVHLRGRILWHAVSQFFLEDSSGTILVQTPSSVKVKAGDQSDVVGFPAIRDGLDEIVDAGIHNVKPHLPKPVPSVRVSPGQAVRRGKDGETVTMSGSLIAESAKDGYYDFRLANHHHRFEVLLAVNPTGGQPLTIKSGAKLEATGQLRLLRYVDHRPEAIELLVNSPDDIVVESGRGVNWVELLSVLAAFAALGTALWIVQMQRTLRAKTALIRKQMAQESQLEDKYRRLFKRSPTAIFIWHPSGRITDCNPAFACMLGFRSPAEAVGKSYWSLRTDKVSARLAAALQAGAVSDHESSLQRTDGRTVYLLENVTRVETEDGSHFETTALDVTQSRMDRVELERAKMAAQREAEVDALTGLANRRRFSQIASRQLKLAAEQQSRVALLFLDLDGFKSINDTLGHLIGDMLLQQVADRLKDQLPTGEVLSRLGGDEFAVLLSSPASIADPEHIAAGMLRALASPFRIADRELTIGSSIGISLYPDLASDYTDLLQQADSAMYAAKQSGRNRAVRYNDDIGRALGEKHRITSELRGAIARREIQLHYQPEFDRTNRQIVRFEALARWRSPSLGNVPPIKFISAAEESGLILELGRYLLELACSDAAGWQNKTGQTIPVAVNISFLQLRSEGFVEMVMGVLKRTGLPSTSLEIEMTESVMLGEFEQCREVLTHLRTSGVKLALDDFGTGYSSLSYLPELPFDRLKIARSFLERANRGRSGETLIEAVISIAHKLGLSVVVEGIETAKELEFIHALGADEVQGYFMGRPGPDPCSVIAKHTVTPVQRDHAETAMVTDLLLSPLLNITETRS